LIELAKGLKGRDMTAQGNALGREVVKELLAALKGLF
jgi:hypothetical protein